MRNLLLLVVIILFSCSGNEESSGCGGLTITSANYYENPSDNNSFSGSFVVKVEGGTPPYTYSYEPINDTASKSASMDENKLKDVNAGTYKFSVVDANGCKASMTSIKEGFVILYYTNPPLYFGGQKITWSIGGDASMSNLNSGSITFGGYNYFKYKNHRLSLFSQSKNLFKSGDFYTIPGQELSDKWTIQFDTVVDGKWGISYTSYGVVDQKGNIIVEFKDNNENGYRAGKIELEFSDVKLKAWDSKTDRYIEKILTGKIGLLWYTGK